MKLKQEIRLLVSSVLLAIALGCVAKSKVDSVKEAERSNQEHAVAASEQASRFLIEMADARMMDIEEGRLAVQRGTKPMIKDYGQLMIKDQTRMLDDIKSVALKRNIILPETISNDKADGLKDLEKTTGKNFDKKFVSMIKIDHERDKKEFSKASMFTRIEDVDIKSYAERDLPTVSDHLDKINKIQKAY